ncbi:MAG: hypothetical protein AB7J35_18350 [Dehalococcoidia bacterium]
MVPSDCSVSECQSLTEDGRDVIVLSPTPAAAEALAYRNAGAVAYLPLDIDGARLLAAIETAEDARPGDRSPTTAARRMLARAVPRGGTIHW